MFNKKLALDDNISFFRNLFFKKKILNHPINIIFSQINTVNNIVFDLKRLNILRKFLIKSYIGRCHALGKPVRGQRTWSNSWNSYKLNNYVRNFISEITLIINQTKKIESINYKVIKKKSKVKVKKKFVLDLTTGKKRKEFIWF